MIKEIVIEVCDETYSLEYKAAKEIYKSLHELFGNHDFSTPQQSPLICPPKIWATESDMKE